MVTAAITNSYSILTSVLPCLLEKPTAVIKKKAIKVGINEEQVLKMS